MTKTIIIYAHPKTGGHCFNILKEVKRKLSSKKKKYELVDLYKINYDPVMKESEHYTSGNYNISNQNKEFQKKIEKAEKLIIIYPVWWTAMPAILKGFFDRVFTSHFAFKYIKGIPVGLLKGKKAAVFIASGAPRIITKFYLGDRPIKIIKKDILKFCGVKSRVFYLGRALKFDETKKNKIEKLVNKGLNYLEV